jgi:hypothetical protein
MVTALDISGYIGIVLQSNDGLSQIADEYVNGQGSRPAGRGTGDPKPPTRKRSRLGLRSIGVASRKALRSLRKEIVVPVTAAILSGVATPLILDLLKGTDTIQSGSESTLSAEFSDSLELSRGAGSTKNTLFRRRCRPIQFSEPYRHPPKVFVALEAIDVGYDAIDVSKLPTTELSSWAPAKAFGAELVESREAAPTEGSNSARVGASVESVTKSGFNLCAYTWSNTRLHSANATWLAVPYKKSD